MKLTPDLGVTSIEKSIAFYRDVLGFNVGYEMPGPDGKLMHADVSSGDASVMFDRLDWMPEASRSNLGNGTGLYFNVGDVDIDAYYASIRAAGTHVDQEIQDQFWGDRSFTIHDPDGYHLTFAKSVRQVSQADMAQALAGMAATPA
jgi:PhnB protein